MCNEPTSSCQMLASVHISFHILRDSKALSYNGPVACPMGHIIPKFRMDAPTACSLRSKTVTLYPRLASALAVAKPTIPAPITIADEFFMPIQFRVLRLCRFAFYGQRLKNKLMIKPRKRHPQ